MILTCPSCGTQYFADEANLAQRDHMVRCAACGHSWKVGAAAADDNVENPQIAHAAMREKLQARRGEVNRRVALTSWLATASIFVLILFGMGVWRNDVVRVWPESASFYRLVGLDVNRFGVAFTSYDQARTFDGTTPILQVWGEVENVTDRTITPPLVLIRMRNDQQEVVGTITAEIEPTNLEGRARGAFRTTLRNPPIESFKLELSYIPREDAARLTVDVRRPE